MIRNLGKVLIAFVVYILIITLRMYLLDISYSMSVEQAKSFIVFSIFVTEVLIIITIIGFSKLYAIPLHKYIHWLSLKQAGILILLGLSIKILYPIYGYPLSFWEGLNLQNFNILDFEPKKLHPYLFLGLVFIGPITEEFFQRGIIFNLLKKSFPISFSLLFSSAISALAHINPYTMWYSFFYSMAFCWIYHKSNNLLAPIIAHSVVNSLAYFTSIYPSPITSPYSLLYSLLIISAIIYLYHVFSNGSKYLNSET